MFKKSNVSSTRLCSFFRGITLHSCKWSFCLLLRHHTYSSTFCFLRCKCDFLTSYYERWCNNSLSFTHTHLHLHILLILSPILHYNCIVILFRSFIFFKDIIFFFFLIFWTCPVACRILVPQPGMGPTSPAVEVWSLNHWTTREVPRSFLIFTLL